MKPEKLIDKAVEARERAYAPYSGFRVGAALLASSGGVFTGCNVENASYGLTVCAERIAIFKAVTEGESDFRAIAVVSARGSSMCGACRQVLREFGGSIVVYLADARGSFRKTSIEELLPDAFDGKLLREGREGPPGTETGDC